MLAIHELRLDQTILAGISADALNFAVELSPDFAFPTDFLGFFAVFYSVAHVCTVCRAVSGTPSARSPACHLRVASAPDSVFGCRGRDATPGGHRAFSLCG